ncbi:MAG: TetR/AcrR family transcriptional regulator [Lachnospiraceae bacterium]|nr:TetR/AcrR family transcriptional regulator [Lachnospiraceae bacterium]MDD3794687.1 TetR/AcrR family transcriptional regulator [Lachnospiraceae bacterium]
MDNKERIMECAEELFYSKGYDATGIQEIVDKAGITKPTLYYYFGSKLGLLQTLLQTKFEQLLPVMRQEAGRQEDIKTKLYHLAGVCCHFFTEERKFYMLMMALFYSARENEAYLTVKPYLTEFYRVVVEVFEKASDQLGNMHGRQKQFALNFIGVLNQYMMVSEEQEPQGREAQKEQVISLVNQFLHGIFS